MPFRKVRRSFLPFSATAYKTVGDRAVGPFYAGLFGTATEVALHVDRCKVVHSAALRAARGAAVQIHALADLFLTVQLYAREAFRAGPGAAAAWLGDDQIRVVPRLSTFFVAERTRNCR